MFGQLLKLTAFNNWNFMKDKFRKTLKNPPSFESCMNSSIEIFRKLKNCFTTMGLEKKNVDLSS